MTTRYRVLLAVAALSLPLAAVHAQDRAPTFRPSVPGIDNPRSGAAEYQDLLPERREVATLNGRLAPADKLTPDQTERLLNLLRDVGQVPWHTGQSPFDSRFIDRVDACGRSGSISRRSKLGCGSQSNAPTCCWNGCHAS